LVYYQADRHIFTEGETFDELKANILDAVNLAFEDLNFIYTIDEIKLILDL
jgi:predicted RNase H-like HicB family nuclease